MKNRIHYSPEALQDLNEIWDYILIDLGNRTAAMRKVNAIQNDIKQLERFAEMGALLSSVADVQGDYRFLITQGYLSFYRVVGNDVYIDRILYGRRNYLRVLFGEEFE